MNEMDGLIFAFSLDGRGGGRELGWSEIEQTRGGEQHLWLHMDYTAERSRRWLSDQSGLEETVCEALIAEETRPRVTAVGDGLLVNLRGVNLNPGADPEDMIAVRLWIDRHRIITLRHRRVRAFEDIRGALIGRRGPATSGEFLVELADRLLARMAAVINELDDQVDALEDAVLVQESYELRPKLADLRRQTIRLRRYLAPQREVMTRLHGERVGWLTEVDRIHLRELADRTTRYVEDLDAARERAAVTQEELNTRIAEQTNKTMYVLSIVAAIFLPLGLLTGLLGINVGGIPGTDSRWAFALVCAFLVGLAAVMVWGFRRMKWL